MLSRRLAACSAALVFATAWPALAQSESATDPLESMNRAVFEFNEVLDRAVLPLVPLLSGSLIAAFIPIRPEALVQYVTQHSGGSRLAYAMWGAAIGQFSDYLYQRFKKMLPAQPSGGSNPPSPPSDTASGDRPSRQDP